MISSFSSAAAALLFLLFVNSTRHHGLDTGLPLCCFNHVHVVVREALQWGHAPQNDIVSLPHDRLAGILSNESSETIKAHSNFAKAKYLGIDDVQFVRVFRKRSGGGLEGAGYGASPRMR